MKVAIIRDISGTAYTNSPSEVKYFADHFEFINRTLIGRDKLNGAYLAPHIVHDVTKGYGVEIRDATADEELYLKLAHATPAQWDAFKNFLNTIGFK